MGASPNRDVKRYWSKYNDVYFTGDGAKRDEDGYFWLLGRVDDVMNVSGHRVSTMEVEAALVDHKSVAEAAVIGKSRGAAEDALGQDHAPAPARHRRGAGAGRKSPTSVAKSVTGRALCPAEMTPSTIGSVCFQ